jgi:hypothetical protein
VLLYLVEVEKDPVRKTMVEAQAGLWFGDTRAELIVEYLKQNVQSTSAKPTT